MNNNTGDPTEQISDLVAGDAHDQLMDHNYDGIQEYDNPLPGWWTFLLWVSIAFAPAYMFYYHGGVPSRSIHAKYEQEVAKIFEAKFKQIGILKPDKKTILEYMHQPKWLAVGKSVFSANCVGCHGTNGEGKVGPNLTDNYWKNVGSIEDIATVISNGAGNGAMPAWENRLTHPNLIVLTAAYVASLSEHPVDGKSPEGREIPEWE